MEQLRFFVITMCKKFRPLVQRSSTWFKQDPVLFFSAKITVANWWIVRWCSCYYIPGNLVCNVGIFQFPNFIAQTCVICIDVFEAMEILTIPLLEVHSAASLCLLGVVVEPSYCGSVHKICDWTSVWQGTYTYHLYFETLMKADYWPVVL